jgi:hypothetical protein
MKLSMSMFASSADYWKAYAELSSQTVIETAQELGCEPDNELMLEAIAALRRDAERYRWLRDAHPATEEVIAVAWGDPARNMRHEDLDAAIDAAMAGTQGEPA